MSSISSSRFVDHTHADHAHKKCRCLSSKATGHGRNQLRSPAGPQRAPVDVQAARNQGPRNTNSVTHLVSLCSRTCIISVSDLTVASTDSLQTGCRPYSNNVDEVRLMVDRLPERGAIRNWRCCGHEQTAIRIARFKPRLISWYREEVSSYERKVAEKMVKVT